VKAADGTEKALPGFEGGFGAKNAYSTDNFFAFVYDCDGDGWNDVLTYGVSLARAMTQQAELVGELNGRVSTRSGGAFPGTETRGLLKFGGRYTRGTVRLDAAVAVGLTTVDPEIGVTGGFTYVFNAFTLP